MKKNLLAALLSLFVLISNAQIKYESGYFIKNNGEKITCLIKNTDWKNNPVEFSYKLSDNAAPQTESIKMVAEFQVFSGFKYKRFTVDIDRSSEELDLLSKEIDPVFKKEELFLKVLIEGKATLYAYEDKRIVRFFYQLNQPTPEELVFKSYLIPPATTVSENNAFRLQLNENLKCEKLSFSDLENLEYTSHDLIKVFTLYNECQHAGFINYEKKIKRSSFNLSIKPGINFPSFSLIEDGYNKIVRKFASKPGFRLGLEAEYVLPFNKNKWSVIAEPSFQSVKTEAPSGTAAPAYKADYKSIEVSAGLRHSFYLGSNNVIFVNAFWQMAFPIRSTIGKVQYFYNYGDLQISYADNFAFGAGFKHNNKYSLEFRYSRRRQILREYAYWSSNYQAITIVAGYTLF